MIPTVTRRTAPRAATQAAAALGDALRDPRAGFFGPGSMVRRINGQRVVYLSGPRALLLQLAHPKVARALTDWSALRRAPARRLVSTFDAMDALLFGDREEALAASRRMAAMHARVVGTMPEMVGRYPRGTPYSAMDPELLLWVAATLVDSTLVAYEAFVGPLTAAEKDRYYQELAGRAPLLGLRSSEMPPSYAAFEAYFRAALDELTVGDDARALARRVLEAPLLGPASGPTFESLAAAMLPVRLREAYGLSYGPRERLVYAVLASGARLASSILPPATRPLRRERRSACPFARVFGAMSATRGARRSS